MVQNIVYIMCSSPDGWRGYENLQKSSTMSVPVVSIIVPNYNHCKFLEQRLASIFNQTYQAFEVIILDDCSADSSLDIIERYRSNPKVSNIIYNEVNSGSPFKQWYKGIQLAKGEYVWIAESDDTCEPCFLETLIGAISSSNKCVLAYCDTIDINENGEIISIPKLPRKAVLHNGRSFIVKDLLLGNTVYNASCAVFKRATALQISKEWLNSRGAGDYFLWTFLACNGKVCSSNQPLTYRRIHDTNVTHKADSSGSNLTDERKIVDYIYSKYHISIWRKILAENLRRRRISTEKFDNEIIRKELLSLWTYGGKIKILAEIITKAYFTLTKC